LRVEACPPRSGLHAPVERRRGGRARERVYDSRREKRRGRGEGERARERGRARKGENAGAREAESQ